MHKAAVALKRKIEKKQVKIAVIGLGYVGLPLALEFTRRGLCVYGIEVDQDRLHGIRKKESYISDVTTGQLRKALSSGKFSAYGDFRIAKEADAVIICVPTPLNKFSHPDISYIKSAVKSLAVYLKKGALVILESTTYPGTTEEVILPLLERGYLKEGRDFYLCFSPERIDPGNKKYPVHKIPKIIGGISKEATILGVALYQHIITKVVPVSSAKVAETAKLLENTFRLINISLIDEMAMMCHKMGIDIWEIVDAAKTKPFGFMPFYPGPGIGGHCIPKDPLYLYWKAKKFGFQSRFIKLSSDIITYMPQYVIERVEEVLKDKGMKLREIKILVIGVTYKKDIKDLRKSPALDIIHILEKKKVKVSYHDPIIPYLKIRDINLKSVELTKKNVSSFDCIIIATDHSRLNYKSLLKNSRLIFDTRNVYRDSQCLKLFKL
jgi:UDP-N-acetyl-D-glucosamine dehydrogenase